MPLTRRIGPVASVVVGAVAVAVVIGVLAVAQPRRPSAVGSVPATSVLPSPTVTSSAAPSTPAPSPVQPSPELTPSPSRGAPSTSPSGVIDVLGDSDQYFARWLNPIHFGYLYYDPESLAEQFEIADLVVRGPIADLYIGEYWLGHPEEKPYPLAYMRIDVQEVLKGEPVSRTEGDVEIQLGPAGSDLESIGAALPTHDNLWFLVGPEGYEGRDFPPQSESEIAPYSYRTTNVYQGILRNIDGSVEAIAPDALAEVYGPDYFPAPLDGTSFLSLLEVVRELGESLPSTMPSASP